MTTRTGDPNDPIQDFVDLQEHRYDPGYWPLQWARRARYDPYYKALQKARLSSFYRAVIITPFAVSLPMAILINLQGVLPHAGRWAVGLVAVTFVVLWFLIHKSMIRAYGRKETEDMEHGHKRNHMHT